MNQVAITGTRKYMGGACAKPLWAPPNQKQRVCAFKIFQKKLRISAKKNHFYVKFT